MVKDITISVLGAIIIADAPWWVGTEGLTPIMVLGFSLILFIFLLFLESVAAEWRDRRHRRDRIRRKMKRLSKIEIKDS